MFETVPQPRSPTPHVRTQVSSSNLAFEVFRPPAVSQNFSKTPPVRILPQELKGSSWPTRSWTRVSERAPRPSSPLPRDNLHRSNHAEADVQIHHEGLEGQNCKSIHDAMPCAGLQMQGLETWLSEKINMAMEHWRTESLSVCTSIEYRLVADIAKLRKEFDDVKREVNAGHPAAHKEALLYDVFGGESGNRSFQSSRAQVDCLVGRPPLSVTDDVLQSLKIDVATSVLNSQTEQLQEALTDVFQVVNKLSASDKPIELSDLKQSDVDKIHIAMKDIANFCGELAKEVRRDRQQRNRDYSETCERFAHLESNFDKSFPNVKEMASFTLDLAKSVAKDRQQRDQDHSETRERFARLESNLSKSPPNESGPQKVWVDENGNWTCVDYSEISSVEMLHTKAKPLASEHPQIGSFDSATV